MAVSCPRHSDSDVDVLVTFHDDKEAFLSDRKTQSVVLYQITVIGEAVKRLSQAFRERHPILPWALMAGMRDHLMPGYDAVDLEEVRKTATRDVPEVLIKFEPLLPQPPGT